MNDEISALQRLSRQLSEQRLHRWNFGQSSIFLHENIHFRDLLKQTTNIVV